MKKILCCLLALTLAISLLTATYGGTTTSDILSVAWNQKVNFRAAQIQIVETA